MLQSLLLLPLIGSCLLLLIPENTIEDKSKIKNIALLVSLINLIVSIFLWVQFDSNTSDYQFVYEFTSLGFCHFNIGVDGISLYYVLLTTFITPIALISNYDNINNKNLKFFVISFLLLETLQIALFVVLDLFLFYIFFESVLPILFIIIVVYGSGENRIRSALLFFLYTLAGSLFMLLAVLQIYSNLGSTDFILISLSEISLESQKILWLAFFLAFAVKTPLWPFTGWLYRAHSDAPLAASILLAGTILKFATYGYLRVLINFLPDATNYFSPLVQTIAIVTLIYASLATIVQQDTKSLIAYSSICHMAVVLLGLFSNTIIGIEGAILLSLGHGFVSPALFICVGGVIYDRLHTRNIPYIRGLVTYMPVFTILFFVFTIANTGIPLSLNFVGEQLSLIGIWDRSPIIAVLGATGIVFSAIYSIYLYNRISYGVYSPHLSPLQDVTRREFNVLIALLIPTVILGILPNVILDCVHLSVSTLIYVLPINPLSNITEYISILILPFLFAFLFLFVSALPLVVLDLFFLTTPALALALPVPAPGKGGKEEDITFPWSRAIISQDHKNIILNPILLVEAHFSFKLCYNHLAIKSIDLTSEMYSDLLKQNKFNLIKYYLSIELSKPIITPSLKSTLNKEGKLVGVDIFQDAASLLPRLMEIVTPASPITKDTEVECKLLSGCYMYELDQKIYIGSSVNIQKRHTTHIYTSKKSPSSNFHKFINDNQGFEKVSFSILYLTNNYYEKFISLYPNYKLSKGEKVLLKKLTNLQIRILEQSLITYLLNNKTNLLNKQSIVSYQYLEWDKQWFFINTIY